MCNDFACVTLFNKINEDNRRLILNRERTLFSFSETRLFGKLVNALYLALTFGAWQPML